MRDVLGAFQSELARLKSYLSLTEQVIVFGSSSAGESWPAEATNLRNKIRTFGSRGFQTSYDGALLGLSADFEQLVSDMIVDFLTALPGRVARYADLPDRIRGSNEHYTGEALSKRGRYADLDRAKLIKNLHDCLNGIHPYLLNAEAIAIPERNLTTTELGAFVGRLGIEGFWQKMGEDVGLQRWAGTSTSGYTVPRIQAKLNDFIKDRNSVAHQGSSTASVGTTVILDYIEYFGALAPALLVVLEQYLETILSRVSAS